MHDDSQTSNLGEERVMWGCPSPVTVELYRSEFQYCEFCCYFHIKYQCTVTSYRGKTVLGFSFMSSAPWGVGRGEI